MKLNEIIDQAREYQKVHGDARVLVQGHQDNQFFVVQSMATVEDGDGKSIVLRHRRPKINEATIEQMCKGYTKIAYEY